MYVHVLTNLFPPDVLGGYELLARDVVLGLQERGHRVDVLTTGVDRSEPDVSRRLRLARPFGSEPRRDRLRHLAAAAWNRGALGAHLALRGRPDAVLAMSLRRLGTEPLRVYQRAGVRSVLTVNDDWPVAYVPATSGPAAWLEKQRWARHTWRGVRVDRVVYLSDAIRRHVLAAGAPLPTGRVQPQGVPLDMFAARPFRPVPPNPSLLFAGRLHPSKAPEVALEAVASLRHRGVEAQLIMAGGAVSDAYQHELRSRSETLGIASQVTWLGQVSRGDLPQLYRAADVFLFPSAFEGEGQGLTYMEAMACGALVVAYPRGGARELLERGGVASLARSCDGEGFAEAVVALQGDEARAQAQGEAATALVRRVSLGAYIDALEEELLAASLPG